MDDRLEFGDLDALGAPLPVEVQEPHLFSLFLDDGLPHSSSDSSSPPSVPSDSPATSPIPASASAFEYGGSLFASDDVDYMPNALDDDLLCHPHAERAYAVKQERTGGVKQEENSSSESEDDSAPSTPSRKRKNKRSFTAMEASVMLSRDELRTMSSKQLQEFAEKLAEQRPLSKSEERALKRQRRLVKNRESAQLSRARKKMYVEELERKVNMVTVHSERMAAQMAHLAAENKALKEEVYRLRHALKGQHTGGSGPADAAARGMPSPAGMSACTSPSQSASFSPLSAADALPGMFSPKRLAMRNARTAGMCLFVVLLSFAVFFSATSLDQAGPALPPIAPRQAVPEVVPKAMRGYTGRALLSVDGGESAARPGDRVRDVGGGGGGGGGNAVFDVDDADDAEMDVEPVAGGLEAKALSGALMVPQDADVLGRAYDGPQPAHVLCTEAYRMDSSGAPGASWSEQPTFTIVLPPAALSGAVPNVDKIAQGQLLEVGCRVLSLNVLPSAQHLPALADSDPERVTAPLHRDVLV